MALFARYRLGDLVIRDLEVWSRMLVVIDGSKALRSAVLGTF